MTAMAGAVNGRDDRVDARFAGRNVIVATNPANGQTVGEVPVTPPDAAADIVARARAAQPGWYAAGLSHRIEMLRALKYAMRRRFDDLIRVIAEEIGKNRFETLTEILPTIEMCAYYQRIAPKAMATRRIYSLLLPHRMHWIERRPYGVVLVIGPWNFPLLLNAAPILAALVTGNAVILKPSEYAPLTGELFASLLYEAGIPRDVFQIVHGAGDLGAALIRARPDKIVFTGSVSTGRKIAAAAGELLIPLTLELGAKDAAIVLDDADLDLAARGIAWGGMYCAGQACLSVERVYVVRSVADRFIDRLKAVLEREIRIGPADAPEATMGVISTAAQLNIIEAQVNEALAQGARLLIGGRRAGQAYSPTLVTNVSDAMRLMRDETFGPVIAIIPADDDEDALRQANASPCGLTGSVWTRNRERGLALARRLEVGHASLNDHAISASLPYLPWGGTKDTGYGSTRGIEGLYEMTRSQSISAESLSPSLSSELFWYPYTRRKYALLYRLMRVLYAPTLGAKLRSLFEPIPGR